MNTHKNARLTYLRRLEMVQDITERGWSASQAGVAHGVSAVTARKWLGRYLAAGAAGLCDKSSPAYRLSRRVGSGSCCRIGGGRTQPEARSRGDGRGLTLDNLDSIFSSQSDPMNMLFKLTDGRALHFSLGEDQLDESHYTVQVFKRTL